MRLIEGLHYMNEELKDIDKDYVNKLKRLFPDITDEEIFYMAHSDESYENMTTNDYSYTPRLSY